MPDLLVILLAAAGFGAGLAVGYILGLSDSRRGEGWNG